MILTTYHVGVSIFGLFRLRLQQCWSEALRIDRVDGPCILGVHKKHSYAEAEYEGLCKAALLWTGTAHDWRAFPPAKLLASLFSRLMSVKLIENAS